MNKKAYTLVEIMMATACTSILIIAVFTFYNLTRLVSSSSLSGQMLEDGANIVLSRIIEGGTEAGGVYRLSQGTSYCIGSGTSPSCHVASTAELHFKSTDGSERWYHLNNTGTSLLYYHPTAAQPAGEDEVIYTAPNHGTITLFFWIPTIGSYPAASVGVSVSLSQQVNGKTVTGSATTLVNLRNHP